MIDQTKKPCHPELLKDIELDWGALVEPIARASDSIGRFDGALEGMVNNHVLMSPFTRREAVLSSQIEGTQATFVEVLEHEAGKLAEEEEKRQDINEIQNYRKALQIGEEYLDSRPITLSLIKELHKVLLDSVRGQDKNPGRFRAGQNWIGPRGGTIQEARFIPPNPLHMVDSLEDLETFISIQYKNSLVQLGMIHAQFEIIHPFEDGNGRVGRMLIPLFLHHKKVLQSPVFYLSEFLEKNDAEYRDRLFAITEEGDWQGWLVFFLNGLHQQAIDNLEKAKQIHALYDVMKRAFTEVTKSRFAATALDTFFAVPIISATNFYEYSHIKNNKTAYTILKSLEEANLIFCIRKGSGRASSIYAMPELINITEGREVFKKNAGS